MHEPSDHEREDAMNKPLAAFGAAAAGALAMYYLDPDLGARRRALLAELLRGSLPGERRTSGRGRLARRASLRAVPADPRSDAELRDRVQSVLDRLVSHPRALDVGVDHGIVRLAGHVLAQEREGMLAHVERMPGVRKVVDAMAAFDRPQAVRARPVPAAAASR
jgi:hypothetical protein